MELVTVVEIELPRPHSAAPASFLPGRSNGASGVFTIADNAVDTVREAVLNFAAQCGVDRSDLHSLKQVPGHLYANNAAAVVFNIDTRNVSYSTPYAICRAYAALRIDGRFFHLSEIHNVSDLS